MSDLKGDLGDGGNPLLYDFPGLFYGGFAQL